MEILQLTYFCHAARTESFSEVARLFRVPPSSVSLSVKRLEDELGVLLFDRTANRLSLNENGRRFYERAATALSLLEGAKGELCDSEGEAGGEIRILIRANRRILTEKIGVFRLTHPKVSFSIHHKPLSSAEEYHIIVSDTPPAAGQYKRLLLLEEKMMVALPKGHALAKEKSIPLSALKGERLISMTRGSDLREYTDRILRLGGISPEVAIECDDPHYIREYVRLGLGIAIYPSVSWKGQFDKDVSLCPIEGDVSRTTYVFVSVSAPRTAHRFASFLTGEEV